MKACQKGYSSRAHSSVEYQSLVGLCPACPAVCTVEAWSLGPSIFGPFCFACIAFPLYSLH